MQRFGTLQNQIKTLYHSVPKRVSAAHLIGGAALLCSILGAVYVVQFYVPGSQNLSFSEATCVRKTVLFPGLHELKSDNAISVRYEGEQQIGSLTLAARSICAQITAVPKENSSHALFVQPLGLAFMSHKTKLTVPSFPNLENKQSDAIPSIVATKETLHFGLDKPDALFSYQLSAGGQRMSCTAKDKTVSCDVSKLALLQAQTYQLMLEQQFSGKTINKLASRSITTVTPITVTASSITNGSTIYDKPASLLLTFDKPIAAHEGIKLTTTQGKVLSTTVSVKENTLSVQFIDALPRGEAFTLSIDTVKSTDKGFLKEPYRLAFRTSTGPKVLASSISSYNTAPNASIRLTFDSAPKPEMLPGFIQLQSARGTIEARITTAGNTVTVTPSRNFAVCEAFTIKVLDGLQNIYGISGNTAWQQQSRSTCRTAFSIGSSAQGRSITAYKFGTGPSTVLYVGATHGSEPSSKYILDSWIDYLESRAPEIPAHRSIVVIPSINPDGIASGSRTNSRGVDLNRNFPANSWKADVTMPGGQLAVNGGGTTPLSEPESAALAAYTLAVKPRLVLTYHAKGSIVTANESGDSMALAVNYGRQTGYRAIAESQLGNTFNYDTTGAYENWLHDKVGIPTLLIELPNHTSNYFSSNRAAMWSMVTL